VRKLNCLGLLAGAAAYAALLASPTRAEDKLPAEYAQAVKVTPVLTTSATDSGQPIVLPQKDVQISVSTYEIPVGAKLPVHKHPYPRYAYVQSGTLREIYPDTGQTETYEQGKFVLEAVDQWHRAENVGSEPLKLLVIDLLPKGENSTILQTK
jgi:quercetin dioxygenase-like cupin family protein